MSRKTVSLVGTLVLACCLAIGLTLGGAAEAKKGKKKGATKVTVAKTTPTSIPVAPNPDQASLTAVSLAAGKKAKGKVVGADSVSLTLSLTGPPVAPPDSGDLGHLGIRLTAPNGRTSDFLFYPDDHNATAIGPVTLSPNSPIGPCEPDLAPPPPPCGNPEDSLGPPYAGTMGVPSLAIFAGVGAKGTWTLRILNGDPAKAFTLTSVSLKIPLQSAPA